MSNLYLFTIVPAGYTLWTQWGACSVSCGVGNQLRTRACINPPPSSGQLNCIQLGLGPASETKACTQGGCLGKLFFPLFSTKRCKIS